MPLKPRPLNRDGGVVKDASLVIIASEDRYAVKQYFSRFKPRRVQFQVLATEDGKSSPEHVLARLRDFVKDYDIGQDDELWLCLDVDHWAKSGHIQNLTSVLQQCKAAEYQIAFCLPCFELWLLLHYRDIDANNLEGHSAASVYQDLKQHCCGFDKTGLPHDSWARERESILSREEIEACP